MSKAQLIAQRFEIQDPTTDRLGRGGMGVVYKGVDRQTDAAVAVKVLDPVIFSDDVSLVERFKREGEALRRLNHPNIVQMVAAVEEDGQHFLVR